MATTAIMTGAQFDALPYEEGRLWELVDVEFALSENHRVRPDVFVLLRERAMSVDPDLVPIPGAPDIAIEVDSEPRKVEAYLRYGTREVWQVDRKTKSVVIHYGVTSTMLPVSEHITTPLLPGFSLAVESLFRP